MYIPLYYRMKITFVGAAREVTGSCHLVETGDARILLDCGMFQGSDFNEGKNLDPFPFAAADIDAVLVTHAHLDHVGRIPKLVREGFAGRIYATGAACELSRLIWDDAYQIMEYNHRKFQSPLLFTSDDVARASSLVHPVAYGAPVSVARGVEAVWRDAGHIFGSAFIEVAADGKRLLVSGDIGNADAPIIKDTEPLPGGLDVLLLESTYGDRRHESREESDRILLSLVKEGIERGGTIMMPAFSLERTQEIMYRLHDMIEHDKTLPPIPIFLDSPLAIDALRVYKKYTSYYDTDAARAYRMSDDFLHISSLRLTYSRDESKQINMTPGPKLVIAGSGMMTGGRILHHARRYLSDPASTLLIVGYQAHGTLGRKLYEGASSVIIFGDEVPVRCTIKAIGALSAHADQEKLLAWIGSGSPLPRRLYCVHGEEHAATELAHRARDRYGIEAFVPEPGETITV